MAEASLAKVLVAEGKAPTGDLAALERELQARSVRTYADESGAWIASRLVVTMYRVAGITRDVVDGLNVSLESVDKFLDFIYECLSFAEDTTFPIVIRALFVHNAASASAGHNGGKPEQQIELNIRAKAMLETVEEDQRNDDWMCVAKKVMVGLFESGAIDFDERQYTQVIAYMARTGAKDLAGRVEFYSAWLESQGRRKDAATVLTMLDDDKSSAIEQIERAAGFRLGLLARLMAQMTLLIGFISRFGTLFR